MIPVDLLDKLREKDPELWGKIAETALSEYEYHDEEFNAWISNDITYTDLFGPAQEAWLQHCLQEAIRARGWGYHIRISRGHEIVSTIIGTGKRASDYFSEEGSTEVEALLRAYLDAIQEAA